MEYSEIEFEHYEDGEVIARVTLASDDSDFLTVEFKHRSGSSELGQMLRSRLCSLLTEQIRKAKKGAYDRGFHEGRNTRRKRPRPLADFDGDLDPGGR